MKNVKDKIYYGILILFIIVFFFIKFPYYIEAPGGVDDISKKIDINGYKSNGSFNLVYVREYKATLYTMLIGVINKDYDIIKKEDVMLTNEDYKSYQLRDKLLMKESISNAIYNAYKESNKKIEITKKRIVVAYITDNTKNDLQIGDEIIKIDGKKIENKKDITKLIHNKDIVKITVINNNKEYIRTCKVFKEDNKELIGILITEINDYKLNPNVSINIESNESGSSAGLAYSLSIYNSLNKIDITSNKKIVVTGTIDKDGNVGAIGGIKYKLKSAVKDRCDLFIVPKDNYKEVIKYKNEYKYKIEILPVSTFNDAIKYLKGFKNK